MSSTKRVYSVWVVYCNSISSVNRERERKFIEMFARFNSEIKAFAAAVH